VGVVGVGGFDGAVAVGDGVGGVGDVFGELDPGCCFSGVRGGDHAQFRLRRIAYAHDAPWPEKKIAGLAFWRGPVGVGLPGVGPGLEGGGVGESERVFVVQVVSEKGSFVAGAKFVGGAFAEFHGAEA